MTHGLCFEEQARVSGGHIHGRCADFEHRMVVERHQGRSYIVVFVEVGYVRECNDHIVMVAVMTSIVNGGWTTPRLIVHRRFRRSGICA